MKRPITIALLLMTMFAGAQDLSKGIALYEENKPDQASTYFSSIKEDHSDRETALYYLGRIAFDRQDYRKAESYFKKALALNANSSQYYMWMGHSIGSYAGEVNIFKKGILAPKIKSAYEKAVELDPKNIGAHKGLIEFYTQAPGMLGGSWEKAEETARTIKMLDVLEGHESLALVYERQEEYDKAEQEYIAASKLDDSRVINLGIFYQGRKKYDEAFSVFEKAYADDPENLNALYQIGRTSALSGKRTAKGIESLNQFLGQEWKEGTPSHAGAHWRLGMIYEKSGDKTKAITHYERSLKEDPDMEQAKEGLKRLK